MFEADFFGPGAASQYAYATWTARMQQLLAQLPDRAYSGASAEDLRHQLEQQAGNLEARLRTVVDHSIGLAHPRTVAHLQTPVLIPAVAAEMLIAALNASMDSFDQAPVATVVEQLTLDWLTGLVGLPAATAAGTFTAGGTQSNYMGLLLARDWFAAKRWQWDVRANGLPPEAGRLRLLCSEVAHFSVEKSAVQLGLGLRSVVKVPCDSQFRMQPAALERTIRQLRAEGLEPAAVVATAGTTDFGSIDPVAAIAAIARREGLWLHVDAAYGGALRLSPRHRQRLAGIEQADSVTLDFHKAFFQPISCGAFLVANATNFNTIRITADYLNSEEREREGIPDLVTRSVLTTRRFDALKLWLSLQALGEDRFALLIDRLCDLAAHVAAEIERRPNFHLLHQPEFGSVVFRYAPAPAVNALVPQQLFDAGAAVLGHTVVHGEPCLKITLCNPCTEPQQLTDLLDAVESACRKAAATGTCAEAAAAHA